MKMTLVLAIMLPILVTSCGARRKGADGLVGGVGADGASGSNGVDGAKGDKGDKGDKGVKGDTGAAGVNAAVIPLKFCPALEDSYGVQYSEHGLCIENKVYAIYSDRARAALVELSNGTYQTTTPQGVNCTFTVSSNCVIGR